MTGEPAWTVIVPTFGRPEPLRGTVAALTRLRPPPGGFEVIVVDDGSPAALGSVGPGVRLHRQANAGPAAARNAGARLARGRRLAFTDDDCQPRPDWLACLDAALNHAAANAMAGGATVNALRRNMYSAASQDVVDHLYDTENRQAGSAGFLASNNLAMPRDRFLDLGGFDQQYRLAAGEDRAFCDAWRGRGWPIVSAPEAVVEHRHRLTLRSFWRQHMNYGRGSRQFHALPAAGAERRAALKTPGYYAALLSRPMRDGAPPREALARSGLLLVAQVATTAGYLIERGAPRRAARTRSQAGSS